MSTLFQIHSSINNLKSVIKDLATHWQDDDSILLLGECCAYLDWAKAYVDDVNYDDESEYSIDNITAWYILAKDFEALNNSAKLNLKLEGITVLKDTDWVKLTQKYKRVVTLNSVT